MASYDWNKERIAELIKLATVDGESFSHIARIMGCSSRNVPLCKFGRLRAKDPSLKHVHAPEAGMRGIQSRQPRVFVPKTSVALPVPKVKAEDVVPFTLEGNLITMENISTRMCRYPIGDPRDADFHFCGNAPKTNSSYCDPHHRACFQPHQKYERQHVGKQRAI